MHGDFNKIGVYVFIFLIYAFTKPYKSHLRMRNR